MDVSSSDNFIHPALVKRLVVPLYKVSDFQVQVGSGELLQCEGEVRNMPVTIQQHTLNVNGFVLSIASEELVLGDIWLETLDTYLVNYKQKFITFMSNDKLVTLQGGTTPVIEQSQFHQFKRMHSTQAILALYTLQMQPHTAPVLPPSQLITSLAPDLAFVLQTYQDVFQTPQGLPPPRDQDHTITLLPHTAPIKVRPYRYPHSQKAEIEKLVAAMLTEGVI